MTNSINSIPSLSPARNSGNDFSGVLRFPEFFNEALFELPPNQRTYVWTDAEVKTFLEDLISEDLDERFFGIVVLTHQGKYQIVDGQQRLTTIALVSLILNRLLNSKLGQNVPNYGKHSVTCENMLFSDPNHRTSRIQYPPGHPMHGYMNAKTDKQILTLVDHGKERSKYASARNIAIAYETINEMLEMWLNSRQRTKEFDTFIDRFFNRGLLVTVVIGDSMYANQLYETLNSRGKPLTQAEIVKNSLILVATDYMRDKQAITVFEQHWSTVLENVESIQNLLKAGCPTLSDFMHYFAIYKAGEHFQRRLIDKKIKAITDTKQKAMTFVKDLGEVMKHLNGILSGSSNKNSSKEIKSTIERIANEIQNKYAFLWVVAGLDLFPNVGKQEDLLELIQIAEIYAFRDFQIGGLGLSQYAKQIVSHLNSLQTNNKNISKLRSDLRQSSITDVFFIEQLANKKFDNGLAFYVLRRYEEKNIKAPLPSDKAKYEIEHIVPKSNKKVGWNFSTAQSRTFKSLHLDRIGNKIMLTEGCNNHIGNKDIEFKINASTGSSKGNCPPNPTKPSEPCSFHYLEQPYGVTRDLQKNFKSEISAITKVRIGSSRYQKSCDFVEKRSGVFAKELSDSKIWTF